MIERMAFFLLLEASFHFPLLLYPVAFCRLFMLVFLLNRKGMINNHLARLVLPAALQYLSFPIPIITSL
jgi:hypothetical protein